MAETQTGGYYLTDNGTPVDAFGRTIDEQPEAEEPEAAPKKPKKPKANTKPPAGGADDFGKTVGGTDDPAQKGAEGAAKATEGSSTN